jgi:hypothetical protein
LSKDAHLVHVRAWLNLNDRSTSKERNAFPLGRGLALPLLKTGTFSVPASFAEHNRTALKAPDPARK